MTVCTQVDRPAYKPPLGAPMKKTLTLLVASSLLFTFAFNKKEEAVISNTVETA